MNDQNRLISNYVQVKQSGFRSVHLEKDLIDKSINESYVITNQARSCFARILNGLDRKPPTRSWTLTGPYGSGKSYFSLFLMNILSTTQKAHRSVFDRLNKVDPVLAAQAIDSIFNIFQEGIAVGDSRILSTYSFSASGRCVGYSDPFANYRIRLWIGYIFSTTDFSNRYGTMYTEIQKSDDSYFLFED